MTNAADPNEDELLREALEALEMPREGVVRWLDYLERFYRQHGAERHYSECLDLVATMRRLASKGPVEP